MKCLQAGVAVAAMLMGAGVAQGADLPVKAAGVNYVKQCTAEGAGFYRAYPVKAYTY